MAWWKTHNQWYFHAPLGEHEPECLAWGRCKKGRSNVNTKRRRIGGIIYSFWKGAEEFKIEEGSEKLPWKN